MLVLWVPFTIVMSEHSATLKKQNETNEQKQANRKNGLFLSFPAERKPRFTGFLESLSATAYLIGHSSVKKAANQTLFSVNFHFLAKVEIARNTHLAILL